MIIKKLYNNVKFCLEYNHLKHFDYWSRDNIEIEKNKRIVALIKYAYNEVPFYREVMDKQGIKPKDIRNEEDLKKLPIITKTDLNKNSKRFISKKVCKENCLNLSSSGTSGRPVTIYYDSEGLYRDLIYSMRRKRVLKKYLGKSNFKTLFIVRPLNTSYKTQKQYQKIFWIPNQVVKKQNFQSILDSYDKIFKRIDVERPDIISTYGSFIEILATRLKKGEYTGYLPKMIKYSSDSLSENTRQFMEKKHKIMIFGSYTSCEVMSSGYQCALRDYYHINEDALVINLVDADNNYIDKYKEKGSFVITNLYNRGTVLINYKVGDFGSIGIGCPCGANCEVIKTLEGREADLIKKPNGELVSPRVFSNLMSDMRELAGYQIIQEKLSTYRIKLIVTKSANKRMMEGKIESFFRKEIKLENVDLKYTYVDELKRSDNGKLRLVMSEVLKNE